MRQAGFRWWAIFSFSRPLGATDRHVVVLYLFALMRGVARSGHIETGAPSTSSDYYMGLYVSAPLLGGLAALLGMTGVRQMSRFLSRRPGNAGNNVPGLDGDRPAGRTDRDVSACQPQTSRRAHRQKPHGFILTRRQFHRYRQETCPFLQLPEDRPSGLTHAPRLDDNEPGHPENGPVAVSTRWYPEDS